MRYEYTTRSGTTRDLIPIRQLGLRVTFPVTGLLLETNGSYAESWPPTERPRCLDTLWDSQSQDAVSTYPEQSNQGSFLAMYSFLCTR